LWPYRDPASAAQPMPMGHEYSGIVEEVGRDVHRKAKPNRHRFLVCSASCVRASSHA
jgi:Zn-dependent alcohol dehydrogenase